MLMNDRITVDNTATLPDTVLEKAMGSHPILGNSVAIQTPSAHNKTQLTPIRVPIKRTVRNQGMVFETLNKIVLAKMSNASNSMPALQAHLEIVVKV